MRRETTGGLLPVLAALLLAVPPTLRWGEIQFGARPRDQMAPSETVVSRSNYRHMYWTCKQQLVHHSVTGCDMRAGDMPPADEKGDVFLKVPVNKL